MKLYGLHISTCTRKVMMTLAEKNTTYDFIKVDLSKGEQKQAPHLMRHPFGVIPVLEDDGFQLYESRAIIRYLDRRLPGVALTPKDLHQYARMEQWINVEQAYFSVPALTIIKALYFAKLQNKEPNMTGIDEAKQKVAHAFEVIAKNLANHDYLAGDSFSLADISWMPYIEYLFSANVGELVNEHAPVKAWWERISHRPTWQKIIKGH